ncbi:G6PDH family F420-dependent oxidoreductase [Knoellia remsis]|uniref:G6PDH family F420-dependent oxidoreductase n=1 Tax=Knoellia remsis TaxID=407159 RepID=A0A2T0TUV0_9MICO|nr:TIGR03557 family F420-dependent LLM class oxidoreductase [Knoellia remsis]PRY49437.1 G6PDH family F420-dependent oxidoreductase [Knoellia remsis]
MRIGYTLMTEQNGPKDLVHNAIRAEEVGFDFEVSSDHYSPWLSSQGHAPYAWSVLGAVAHATERVELMTYVTCPTVRYHPAVVAQKAATLQLLADGRFILGVGSGESLNEHVVGQGWPSYATRQDMLREAIEIIRDLHSGDLVDFHGDHYKVESARIWDVPDQPVEIGVAVSGPESIGAFAPLADHLIAVEPDAELVSTWNDTAKAPKIGGQGKRKARAIGQIPICWDPDEKAAVKRAHDQFRWFGGGGPSTPTCRRQPGSRERASSSGPRTSPSPSRAAPTSTRSPRRSSSTTRPASPTSPSSRSAASTRTRSSTRPPRTSSPSCADRTSLVRMPCARPR